MKENEEERVGREMKGAVGERAGVHFGDSQRWTVLGRERGREIGQMRERRVFLAFESDQVLNKETAAQEISSMFPLIL